MTRIFLSLFLILLCTSPLCADLLRYPVVSGHLKTLNMAYQKGVESSSGTGFFAANSLRFALKGELGDQLELDFALNSLLLYSTSPVQISLPQDSLNLALDLEKSWNRGERWSNQATIDRLSLKGSFADFDWKVGRQAVGFGRITIFSPLDVIAPFAPSALDTDIRPGVDALHGVRYFGLGGQIGGTIVFGENPENNSYLLTLSENRSGVDLLGIGGVLRDRELIGAGLAGSLGPLGIKAELSHFNGKNRSEVGGDLHAAFDIGALELWYRFDNGLVVLSEYLYNGAGAKAPADYGRAATSAAFQEGLSFLLGQHYLLLGPSWEVHPLATLSGLVIRNLVDDSTLLRPQIQFSLGDNLSLDLFYSLNFGRKPAALTPSISIPQSEFGSVGDNGGLLLRWYF